MATRVTIQDIASELQLSRNTVSKAINNTGVLADATREKILRKAAEMGYKQFAYLPLFQEDAAKAAEPFILPSDKREIAMLTTQFLSSSHFSSTARPVAWWYTRCSCLIRRENFSAYPDIC